MEETSILRPLSFGQIYATTLALIRRTPAAVIIAFVILMGLGVLQTIGTMSYLDAMVQVAGTGGLQEGATPQEQAEAGQAMMQGLTPLVLAGALSLFGAILVMTMLVVTGWFSINGEDLRPGEMMSITFGRPFWMALLQTLIIVFFAVVLSMIVAVFCFAIMGEKSRTAIPYISMLLLFYPLMATIFRIHNVVAQDRGPWQGMIASIVLANSNFLRLFGTLMLAAVAYGAFSVLVGLAMGQSSMMGMSMGGDDGGLTEAAAREMRDNVTWGRSIVSSLLNSLFLIFISYLLTPLYVDLRARRGDFDPELEESYGG